MLGVQVEGFGIPDLAERWFCRDLKLMIVTKRSSAKLSTLRQFTSLQPGEPPVDLFRVPND
jgi:hypothetical protein